MSVKEGYEGLVEKEHARRHLHELKKKGKLEEFMAKRRKKNAAKDHKQLPFSRRG